MEAKAFKKYNLITVLGASSVLFFSYLMLQIIIPYLSGRTDIYFLLTKQRLVHKLEYITAFYIHIFSSIFVLLAGVTQFSKTIMFNYPAFHRLVGKIYVFIILFVSGPGALWMSLYANGGTIAKISFVILTILWWFFTFKAFQLILRKDFIGHSDFMIRSYALTFSAVTLRLYQFALSFFRHENPLSVTETYILLAFLSWLPNLLLAEILIRNGISKKKFKNHKSYSGK